METFLEVLRSPITSGQSLPGCGLSFVAKSVKEHYDDSNHRSNNLATRLIGRQDIALARYGTGWLIVWRQPMSPQLAN